MTGPRFHSPQATLWHGDCLDVMRTLPDASIDSVVTDPPYGISFMGKQWDQPDGLHGSQRRHGSDRPFTAGPVGVDHETTTERSASMHDLSPHAMRSFQDWTRLKPGGHLLAFGGTRTFHRLAAGIEDAGFEIRDSIAWLYGSGFPKSLNVAKAIDRAAGVERPVLATIPDRWAGKGDVLQRASQAPADTVELTAAGSDDARAWEGWGTALKPAFEPVVVARKPLGAKTVAGNVLEHGVGALNIDGCRVPMSARDAAVINSMGGFGGDGYLRGRTAGTFMQGTSSAVSASAHPGGRWPANVILDESQAAALDRMAPDVGASRPVRGSEPSAPVEEGGVYGRRGRVQGPFHGDTGGAARFFKIAKEDECSGLDRASTAGSTSSRPSGSAASARSDAATSEHPARAPRSEARSTNDTANEFEPSGGSGMSTIPTTEHASSHERLPAAPTPIGSPASDAATRAQTGTTTITRSPSTSGGFAAYATLPTTPPVRAAGDPASRIGMVNSRFWYSPKAAGSERPKVDGVAHPTVKPVDLMRWLVRLVTPPGGTVLEPFAGSGTTVEAAVLEGFRCVAIERETEYLPLIMQRVGKPHQVGLFDHGWADGEATA